MTQAQPGEGTYVDKILAVFQAHPGREALVHGDRRLSYAQAAASVLRLATALHHRGLRTGDAVALLAANNPDGVLAGFAVHLLGCRLVFTPPEAAAGERAAFLRRAGIVAYLSDPAVDAAADLAAASGARLVFSLGPGGTGEDLLALAERYPAGRPVAAVGPGEVSTVFHTGGTTGRPKMVLHRHPYYDALIFGADRRYFTFPEPYRFLVATTLSHTSGHMCAIVTLLAGGTVVLMDGFDAGRAIQTIQDEGITSTMLLPAMLAELLDHPALPPEGFPALARVNYGGAPFTQARLRQAMQRLGPVLRQTYALTEAPTITVMTPADHDDSVPGRLSACGKPLPGLAEISLRDETGEVGTGEVGEVWVRGPLVMAEYWKDPELTRAAVSDGWLRTGDLGRFDTDGFLHLVDRVSDMIVTGCLEAGIYAGNVYTNLLMDVVTAVPGVRAAAAVGVPDETYGEAVHVFCVTDPAVTVDPAEIRKRAVAELGPLYEPRAVTFAAELPYTVFGKPDKQALRRLAAASPG